MINKTKRRKHVQYKTRRRPRQGGDAIASGSFGCVFRPQLKCQGRPRGEDDKISKLMTESNAVQEMEEISKIFDRLKTITNYNRYFMLDNIDMCIPDIMSNDDLNNFDTECDVFRKHNIKKRNVNKHLSKLRSLNIPFGGRSLAAVVEDIYGKNIHHYNLGNIQTHLISLFEKAILPMNLRMVFHCDLKSENVVYHTEKEEIKIIDWGLSIVGSDFSSFRSNYKFFFNRPFGSVLLTDFFEEQYLFFQSQQKDEDKNYDDVLFDFVVQFVYDCIGLDEGHMYDIDFLMQHLFFYRNERNVLHTSHKYFKYNATVNHIAEHLLRIIDQYVDYDDDNQTVSIERYLSRYQEDIDKWGFLSIYMDFIFILEENPHVHNNDLRWLHKIKEILIKHLFTFSFQGIDETDVLNDLHQLKIVLTTPIPMMKASKKRKERRDT
jgi:hypothetical protein